MKAVGIDIGSTYTKYCVADITGSNKAENMEFFCERTPVLQKEHFAEKRARLRERYGDCPAAACGYGRKNAGSGRNISELTALAKGAACLVPDSYAVLDIGGQDTKLVCQRNGKIEKFFVNEKCAAGSGLFLGNVLGLLDLPFEAVDLRGAGRSAVRLSSVCAVFAQSEIVERIAEGAEPMGIVHAVLEQILIQAKPLTEKAGCEEILLTGGLARVPGLEGFAREILGKPVTCPGHAQYLAALGCALTAADLHGKAGRYSSQ